MRKLIASVIVGTSLFASNAFAWGDREQGILAGAAGLWVIQQLNKPNVQSAPAPVYTDPRYPGTVFQGPAPSYTYRPMYRAVDVFIPECNCYRTVMVQVN